MMEETFSSDMFHGLTLSIEGYYHCKIMIHAPGNFNDFKI